MPTSLPRRYGVVLAALAILSTSLALVAATPAHAATGVSGYFLIKGTGSYYTPASFISRSANPGATVSFDYKVVNSGQTASQFRVFMQSRDAAGLYVNQTVFGTSTLVKSNVYYTPVIAPGQTYPLTLKVTVPSGGIRHIYGADLFLQDPAVALDPARLYEQSLDDGISEAVRAAPSAGTTNQDLYLSTGTQPRIGGSCCSDYGQTDNGGLPFLDASVVKPASTATFTLRLQNDGAAPSAIPLRVFVPDYVDVKCRASVAWGAGSSDVSATVLAGTYVTPTLAPGAHKDLTMRVHLFGCDPGSDFAWYVNVYTDNVLLEAAVPVAA
jgi:hypothetical protein